MIVTINGSDGSGKSKIIGSLLEIKELDAIHYHSRPGNIVPKKGSTIIDQYIDRPDDVPKRQLVLQITKILLFLVEFQILAIWHIIFNKKKLIILERSLLDLYVHPTRYGIDLWLVEKFRFLLVDWYSDLNILLTGDPKTMASRKQELVSSKIKFLNGRYEFELTRSTKRLVIVNTTNEPPSSSLKKIISCIQKL